MPARLALLPAHRPVRHVYLDPDRRYVIGRGDQCELHLDDPLLSRRHAELLCDEGAWILRDLGSKNGVLVDGRPVDECRLKPGAILSFGGILGRYEEITEEALEAERREGRERRETTREMARQLDPSMGLERLLLQVLDSVLSLTRLNRGFVLVTTPGGGLRVAVRRDLDDSQLRSGEFSGSWGAIRMALETARVVVSDDLTEHHALGGRPSIVAGNIRSLACVPLATGENVSGLVYADSRDRSREFTELDVELLESLCSQAAIAIGIARLNEELGSLQGRLAAVLDEPQGLERLLEDRLPAYRATGRGDELLNEILGEGSQ